MAIMEEVLRVTDRFYNASDPDTIDRQSQLQQCLLVVLIVHVMMMVAFWKGYGFEKAHPRIIHDVDVAFEFSPPPPEPPPMAIEGVKGIGLSAGENPTPGSEGAPKPADATKLAMPAQQLPAVTPKPTPAPAKPIPSRKAVVQAPVAVTPTNVIKTAMALPKPSALKPPPVPIKQTAPTASTTAPSGQPVPGGAPTGVEGGAGAGGVGQGGGGTGQGDPGAGTGFAGGGQQIATRLPVGATRAMGNIGPYRKDLLMRLAQNWKPKQANQNIIVLITLAHDGQLLSSEIFQSSGNKKSDKEALASVQETQFAPLPEWYKGNQLTFKIELSKVEAVSQ